MSLAPTAVTDLDTEWMRDLEGIELDLLLEAIYRTYGYDFRHYARGSIRRRIWRRARAEGMAIMWAAATEIYNVTKTEEP